MREKAAVISSTTHTLQDDDFTCRNCLHHCFLSRGNDAEQLMIIKEVSEEVPLQMKFQQMGDDNVHSSIDNHH